MQTNKTLTNLNLESNNLGPEGGKAFAKMLEVSLSISSSPLSMTANVKSLLCMHFCTQMITGITELDLGFNGLGTEAGKALAKSLEVVFTFSVNISLSDTEY